MAKYLDEDGLEYFWGKIKIYTDGQAATIPYAQVDSTSTATVFTATVQGITELRDGVTVMLHNGVVTSASGFTVNINGLGAKPCYNNLTNATRETTIFNVAYTMMFVYSTALNNGDGGWWIYRGYDANTNTIGYQLRTNSVLRPAKVKGYRYRIWFTALDGKHWVPANESSSTNATTSRTPSDEVINPFGEIVYNSTNGTVNANANIPAATAWQQYTLSLGYSFNHEGNALNLTYPAPVYVKCQPQASGGVVMKDYTQTLPSTDDGYVYLFLGMAYNATNIELFPTHPCYHYKDGAIRLWTNAAASSTVTVDSALSSTSENPVQNKVINTALGNKASVDSVPNDASIDSSGLITFKHGTTSLFTLQLPIYEPPSVTLITFTMPDGSSPEVECNAEEGMTFDEWLSSEYYTGFINRSWAVSGMQIRSGNWVLQLNGTDVLPTDAVQEGAVYSEFFDD